MIYLLLCLGFVAGALAVTALALCRQSAPCAILRAWWKPWVGALAVVLVLTAVFDNLMIAVGLMEYSAERTSGLTVGVAPLEDFSYPIAAAILLPGLWLLIGGSWRVP